MLMFPKTQKRKKHREKKEPSVMQSEKYCYITYKRTGVKVDPGTLHRHHVFYGNKDKGKSEQHGLWCYLLPEYHNQSNIAVHCMNGQDLDLELKRDCQRLYEEKNGKEAFAALNLKNYL